jgi:hypothetical protein
MNEHTDAEAIGQEYGGMYVVYRYWMNKGVQYQVIDADGTGRGYFESLQVCKKAIDTINKIGFYRR